MLLPPSKALRALIDAAWRGVAPDIDLDKMIASEPAFTQLLVKTANARNRSAGREMEAPKRAILQIGTTSTGHIALTSTLLTNLISAPAPEDQRAELWEDCMHRGAASMILADRYGDVHPDAALSAGMCLEFGKLLLLEQFPDRGYEFDKVRQLGGQERMDAEEDFFDSTHIDAFLRATEHWHLPQALIEAIENHHQPPETIAKVEAWRLCSILRWSDMISEVLTAPDIETGLQVAINTLSKEAALSESDIRSLVDKIALQTTQSSKLLDLDVPEQLSLDVRVQRTQGQNRPNEMSFEDLLVFVMALREDKDRLEAEVQGLRVELHTMREFDALTKLPNRRHFMTTLRKEIGRSRRYNRPLSVVFVDLDDFTELNARYGQQAGDEILKKCTSTLSRVVRDVDFLARVGGDEFAAILPETHRGAGPIVAERARAAIEAIRVSIKDQLVRLSATVVGVSLGDLPTSADHDDIHGVVSRQLRKLHSRGGNRASWVDVDPVSAARARNKK